MFFLTNFRIWHSIFLATLCTCHTFSNVRSSSPFLPSSTMSKAWKSVPLEGDLKVKGFSEGLVGIETLGDYSLVGKGNKVLRTKAKTNKKGVKRPTEAKEGVVEPPKKKKKTRQKRKPKVKKIKPEEAKKEEEDAEESSEEESEVKSDEKEAPSDGAWSDLFAAPLVSRALVENGMLQPTAIQSALLPAAIKGRRDIVGAAETGKTKSQIVFVDMYQIFRSRLRQDFGLRDPPADRHPGGHGAREERRERR